MDRGDIDEKPFVMTGESNEAAGTLAVASRTEWLQHEPRPRRHCSGRHGPHDSRVFARGICAA